MSATIILSTSIYPPACLRETVAAYQGLCQVKIVGETPTRYAVEISRAADVSDEEQLTNEFLNYLLDLSVEKHLTELQGRHGAD